MKYKLLLTMLLLTILGFIICSGCGGDDGITTPSSITNQEIQNYGSITIKVIWPENGTIGKCIFSNIHLKNGIFGYVF